MDDLNICCICVLKATIMISYCTKNMKNSSFWSGELVHLYKLQLKSENT